MALSRIPITILTGTGPHDAARKSFRKDAEQMPVLVNDYAIGKTVCWRVEHLTPGAELLSLAEIIDRVSVNPRAFRIYGEPLPFLRGHQDEAAERKNVFFEADPRGVFLLELDVDGWKTPVEWWQSPAHCGIAIHELLVGRQLDYLAAKPCLCMLSQGAWPGGPLKAHLYYILEEPVRLEDLRLWAKSVNARLGTKEIDASVFRAVQPDYIAPRECTNFPEPFPRRVFEIAADEFTLCDEPLATAIRRECGDVAQAISRGEITTPIDRFTGVGGDGWALLALSGTGGEINEYGYRAAARIVRAEGKAVVLASIDSLASRMHEVAWNGLDGLGGILANSEGARGDRKDAATYTIDRYRQYLFSACEAAIGDEHDRCKAACEAACAAGASALFDHGTIEAAARLKMNWLGSFSECRARVVASRHVQIKLWDKEVEAKAQAIAKASRPTQDQVKDAFHALAPRPDGLVLTEDGKLDELAFYNTVASTYDWIHEDGQTYLIDRLGPHYTDQGGYHPMPLGTFKSHLTRRVREVLHNLDPALKVPMIAEQIITDLIQADIADKQQIYDGSCPSKAWGHRRLRKRSERVRSSERVRGGGVLWVNLGFEGERFNCLRCTQDGILRLSWREALQRYPDAPVWVGRNFRLGAGHNDPHGLTQLDWEAIRSGGLRDSPAGAWSRKLFALISLFSPDDEVIILAWLLSVLLDWDTRFILQLNGLQGAGKSVAGDLLCALVDPPAGEDVLRTQANLRLGSSSLEARSLSLSLRGRSTAMFDNLRSLSAGRQELLCTVATGMSIPESVKYLNAVDHVQVKASVIITGISGQVTQPDLKERVLSVELMKRDAYPLNLEELFLEARGPIIDGLVRMAMLVLRELDEQGERYGTREGLIDAISRVYYGTRGEEVLQKRRAEDSSQLIKNDRFASCFMAWLHYDTECWGIHGRLEGAEVSASQLYEEYKRWFYGAMNGRTLRVNDGYESFDVAIAQNRHETKRPVPDNPVHFARQMMKWKEEMEQILSAWLGGSSEKLLRKEKVTAQNLLTKKTGVHIVYTRKNNRSVWVIFTI